MLWPTEQELINGNTARQCWSRTTISTGNRNNRKSRLNNSSKGEEELCTSECPPVLTSHLQRVSEKGFTKYLGVGITSSLPLESVAASCHLPLHACNRSLFARGLSIDSRAHVISQHARWPIRTPEWSSRLGGQGRVLFTQPCCTPEHERHLVISFKGPFFTLYIFPPQLSVFGHRSILIWGIETYIVGGCAILPIQDIYIYIYSQHRLISPRLIEHSCNITNFLGTGRPHWK